MRISNQNHASQEPVNGTVDSGRRILDFYDEAGPYGFPTRHQTRKLGNSGNDRGSENEGAPRGWD